MPNFRRLIKPLSWFCAVSGTGALVVLQTVPKINEYRRSQALLTPPTVSPESLKRFSTKLPSRDEHIQRMSSDEVFDVLVIGGGATGAGVAVDAASRGLSTCLVERDDFASGTSSRSTKLIHGGVRYLEKAFFNLDLEQLRMVNDALSERANLIDIAPHLAYPLPIMLPVYKLWQLPYFWAGIKMYDLISGNQILKSSYYMNKTRVLENFPLLRKDKLVGGLVYYDGQHEDARMCLCLTLTASRYGAAVGNYLECVKLTKAQPKAASEPEVNGAIVRDKLTGKEMHIKAKCVINATGPYTDAIRQMDDAKLKAICQPSSGVHIILPGYFTPSKMGLLDPKTSDGRLIFFLPWLNYSLAGTTDTNCTVTDHPSPSENEVDFILNEIRTYLTPDVKIRRGDVLSAWSGIRPLIQDPKSSDTQSIARNHIIDVAPSKLITIAGGKWTTYRSMAEETVDKAIEVCNLPNRECQTKGLLLEGAHGWTSNLYIRLVQDYGLDVDVAKHLTTVYGDKAIDVANRSRLTGSQWPIMGKRLHPEFPFIEAEVSWACNEYACHVIDFVARRTRMAFLNAMAAKEVLPRVAELMGEQLNWDKEKQQAEVDHAMQILNVEMALPSRLDIDSVCTALSKSEIDNLTGEFRRFDRGNKGYLSLGDLDKLCEKSGHNLPSDTLKSLMKDADFNQNHEIDLNEFLHFMDAIKSGKITSSPLLHIFRPPASAGVNALLTPPTVSPESLKRFSTKLPSRDEHIQRMSSDEVFDVLVIGGGATGAGVAVDAASRGLSTCLVERDDFASGTSSRSTKLIHGGVRYLEKAFFNLDLEQLRMVNDALSERANLIDIAPHLAYPLPIMLPVYKLWQLPYFWAGIKMYDLISGSQILKSSYYMNKTRVLENFPLLRKDKLVGGLVYYDGQHEDARMCLCLTLTASRYGAAVGNYLECVKLTKAQPKAASEPEVNGAIVRDKLTGKEMHIKAKCVINATGPYTDAIRQMDDAKLKAICQPSSGVHIILPGYFTPSKMGLLDPKTSDGRLIFFLPWLNYSLAGTTDTNCTVTDHPSPSENEVDFILNEIRTYLTPDVKIRRGDVLSAWSGIRPLIQDPKSSDTQSIARNHIIDVAPSKLITIAGGKWTTYRSMAEETVDKAIEVCNLPNRECQTKGLLLEGAHGWTSNLYIRLVQDYGLDVDVAKHLTTVYGDKAIDVANRSRLTGSQWPIMGKRLHPEFPFIEAEVSWACNEYACHVIDFVARRTRMAFLNAMAAKEVLPRVAELMGEQLNWDKEKQQAEVDHAMQILNVEMALPSRLDIDSVCTALSKIEIDNLTGEFRRFDRGNKGYLSLGDLDKLCEKSGHNLPSDTLKSLMKDADFNQNHEIDLNEFLHFMDAIKSGKITSSPLLHIFHPPASVGVNVSRSGGGV